MIIWLRNISKTMDMTTVTNENSEKFKLMLSGVEEKLIQSNYVGMIGETQTTNVQKEKGVEETF